MDDARFWALIDLLDGVADDGSVARLSAQLAADEVDAFGAALDEAVEGLLARCRVPATHEGDAAELLAAAVVAAGRSTYRSTRETGGELDPGAWRWEGAEALLVAGLEGDDEWDRSPFVLQWLTADLPDGVGSAWTGEEPALPDGVDPDDPAFGFVPATDPAWDAARDALHADAGVAEARRDIGARFGVEWDAVHVWLVLRDGLTEPDITLWAPDGEPADPADGEETPDDDTVVVWGATPAADLRGLDGPGRTAAYLELVTGLLQVVLDDA
ncbi:hypothetical protein GCM10009737_35810 [Nocardioides lentus]|uniref:DUF4240 domain-containing protein n=1 Tax=Nocardioides lentus TaxID=338077 RepID=A0ABN2PS50_9ACTN